MSTLLHDPSSPVFWIAWAIFLVWQNYTFTMVSRARNSGSLRRHVVAALQSNGVWFVQTLFMFASLTLIMDGRYGTGFMVLAAIFYTFFTMVGSIYSHYRALQKERGLEAVGASRKYAQITVEEWNHIKTLLSHCDHPRTPPQFHLTGAEERKR